MNLGPNVHHLIYANDLQVYLRFRVKSWISIFRISNVANSIMDWAVCHRLKLNVAKTNVYFRSQLSISIGDAYISFETFMRGIQTRDLPISYLVRNQIANRKIPGSNSGLDYIFSVHKKIYE